MARHPSILLEQVLRVHPYILCAAFCFAATLAHAAGVRLFDVPPDAAGGALTGAVWYPCNAPRQEATVGDRMIAGAKDCQIVGDKLPLVVVSHGRTGWFGGHHDIAAAMADAGFVVAAINHPGDNTSDRSRVDHLSVLVERPVDIKRLVDYMLMRWPDARKIDRERIGLFGFSMGGYTGLVVLGADPDFRKDLPGCQRSDFTVCTELQNDEIPAVAPAHDPRVRAAVIVDPGPSIFFPAENLKAVTVPIQLWSSDPKLSATFTAGCCATAPPS
jgi:predicted dienelactone hydrolase